MLCCCSLTSSTSHSISHSLSLFISIYLCTPPPSCSHHPTPPFADCVLWFPRLVAFSCHVLALHSQTSNFHYHLSHIHKEKHQNNTARLHIRRITCWHFAIALPFARTHTKTITHTHTPDTIYTLYLIEKRYNQQQLWRNRWISNKTTECICDAFAKEIYVEVIMVIYLGCSISV